MPVYSTHKYKDGALIGIWEITESEKSLQEACSLPSNEEEEMGFITSEQRRKERLAIYLLLYHLFGKKIYLGYHDNGRPFLQNEVGDISIAHTKRFVTIVYHPTAHVGIDIECTTRNFSAVERKALSETERGYLAEKKRDIQLCIIWGAKEALYKQICTSGIDFSKQFEIEKFTPHKKGKLFATYTDKEFTKADYQLHYEIVDDHAMVWVVD